MHELERRAWLVILESINAHKDAVNVVVAGFDAFVFTGSVAGTVKVWRRELQNQALPGNARRGRVRARVKKRQQSPELGKGR